VSFEALLSVLREVESGHFAESAVS
jgi:hypothetical protein